MVRIIGFVALGCLVSACSTYTATPVSNSSSRSAVHRVDVLYSAPQRPYEVVGIVSAKKYKPGFTDPSVADAVPQLQAAGAQVRADAVIVRHSRSNNDRHITVEGEAIRYTN